MLYSGISDIFNRYINNAQSYESVFKNMLKTMEPSIDDALLQQLPQNLFLYAKDLVSKFDFSKGRDSYIKTGRLFGNDFLTKYMDKAVEDFKTNPQGSIDLLKPAQQDAFYGQIYEGFIAGLTSNPDIISRLLGLNKHGKIGAIGKGLGTERHPGDIQMFLYDFDLNKAVDLGNYIEVKYSDDYMQTIAKTYSQSTEKFATTDQVWEQIYEEIQKGLETSISANYSTGWMEGDMEAAWNLDLLLQISHGGKVNRNLKQEYDKIKEYVNVTTPKSIIYIMKNEGLWLSELLGKIEPIVQTNAAYIVKNKIYGINKKRLWYGAR